MHNRNEEIAPTRTFTMTNSSYHPMITHSKDGTSRLRAFLSTPYQLLLSTTTSTNKPTSYTQASKDTRWVATTQGEYDARMQNNTWTLVPYSPSMNVVTNR